MLKYSWFDEANQGFNHGGVTWVCCYVVDYYGFIPLADLRAPW